ncbi:MAG: DUF6048 family protein [Bacteroidota bacterium]|nr:DUF6048 family protein [Bacteroidota bacterium]
MRRTYAYFISLLILTGTCALQAQDTVMFPLKLRLGFDLVGPGYYYYDKNNLNLEGHFSVDKSEKMSFAAEGGYLNYKYSQYNYNFQAKGIFIKAGVDFNLLKPPVSSGRYWGGIGLRYGLTLYQSQTPSFQYKNYWDTIHSFVPKRNGAGHFLEVAPGIRTEIFKNVSIGWIIRLRLLISAGGGKDLRPIYFPGYGDGSKSVSAGINYYVIWSIPYKTKRVITKPPPPEEPEETETGTQIQQTNPYR